MSVLHELMPLYKGEYEPAVVQNPWQRQHDLAVQLNKAERYVEESTMLMLPGLNSSLLCEELLRTSQRGIPTTLRIGAINGYVRGGSFVPGHIPRNMFMSKNHPDALWTADFYNSVKALNEAGIRTLVHNPPQNILHKLYYWMGSDHRKIGVIDGTVGWFKDYNHGETDFDMLCYAIRFQHPPTVKALENQLKDSRYIDEKGEYHDDRHAGDLVVHFSDPSDPKAILSPYAPPYELLMDRGDAGKSVMLDKVREVSRKDGPALFATQYSPSGRIAHEIQERAKREQPTLVITSSENDPNAARARLMHRLKSGTISGKELAAIKWDMDTKDNPFIETVFHNGLVHSKAFLVLTSEGVIGIVGTNNFNDLGIIVGTQEFGFNFIRPSLLASELRERHLLDVSLQKDHPQPFSNTKFRDFYIPLTGKI